MPGEGSVVTAFNPRINQVYGAMWWRLVYAAQPSYRARREDEPLTGSLIEQQAERAAILDCQRRGILDPDPIPRKYPERDHVAPPRILPPWQLSQESDYWRFR